MITISVKRGNPPQQRVQEVSITGHALYDDYGKDIVCAAVSSISINLINASEAILDVPLETRQGEGELVCIVPESRDPQVAAQVQLLMETLVFSLKSISKEYPSFVSMTDQHNNS